MSRKIEYVYVMTNEAFDKNVVKIGKTDDIERRPDELYTTSVPTPFVVRYAVAVLNAYSLEQKMHRILDSFRISQSREFFNCGIDKAISTLEHTAREHGQIFDVFNITGDTRRSCDTVRGAPENASLNNATVNTSGWRRGRPNPNDYSSDRKFKILGVRDPKK